MGSFCIKDIVGSVLVILVLIWTSFYKVYSVATSKMLAGAGAGVLLNGKLDPETKTFLNIVSGSIFVENLSLQLQNQYILAPRIKQESPLYYHNNIAPLPEFIGGGFSGGGAGRSY